MNHRSFRLTLHPQLLLWVHLEFVLQDSSDINHSSESTCFVVETSLHCQNNPCVFRKLFQTRIHQYRYGICFCCFGNNGHRSAQIQSTQNIGVKCCTKNLRQLLAVTGSHKKMTYLTNAIVGTGASVWYCARGKLLLQSLYNFVESVNALRALLTQYSLKLCPWPLIVCMLWFVVESFWKSWHRSFNRYAKRFFVTHFKILQINAR